MSQLGGPPTSWLVCIAPLHGYNLTYRYEQVISAGDAWLRGRVAGIIKKTGRLDNHYYSTSEYYVVLNFEFRVAGQPEYHCEVLQSVPHLRVRPINGKMSNVDVYVL